MTAYYSEHEMLDTAPHPCPLSSKRRGSRDSLSLDRERVRVRVTEM
jgi:hypothetical protein